MESVVGILSALTWPITLFVIVFIFRGELRALLGRLVAINKQGVVFDRPLQAQTTRTEENAGLGATPPDSADNGALLTANDSVEELKASSAPAYHPFIDEIAGQIQSKLPTECEKQVQWLLKGVVDSFAALHMERIYAVIYGSQIRSLEEIMQMGGRIHIGMLSPFYQRAKHDYPDLYKDYPLERWLGFMLAPFGQDGSGLVKKISEDIIDLAPAGLAFIPYVRTRGYSLARAG